MYLWISYYTISTYNIADPYYSNILSPGGPGFRLPRQGTWRWEGYYAPQGPKTLYKDYLKALDL